MILQQTNVKMMTMMTLFLIYLTIASMNLTMTNERKTTDNAAQGKSAARHVNGMIMGSVLILLKPLPTLNMSSVPDSCPDWLNKFGDNLANKVGANVEIRIRKEISELKDETNKEICKLGKSVEAVQISNAETSSKVDALAAEMERMKAIRSEVVVPESHNYSKEDVDFYCQRFNESKRSIGFYPYKDFDFGRSRDWLIKEYPNKPNPSQDDIMTVALADFWKSEMGMDDIAIDGLMNKVEMMWIKKIQFGGQDPDNLTLFVRFKDVAGRKTAFMHAKLMNAANRKYGHEERRLVMDVIPQLKKRHTSLIVVAKMIRDEAFQRGKKCHTRIECSNNTLELQVKEEPDEYHRPINIRAKFPEVVVPGIEYDKRSDEEAAARPEVYRPTSTKTPPGRLRQNNPKRNPSRADQRAALQRSPLHQSPRLRLAIGDGSLGRGRGGRGGNRYTNNNNNANLVPLGQRPVYADPNNGNSAVVTAAPTAAAAVFGGNLLNLDEITNEQDIVVTVPSNVIGLGGLNHELPPASAAAIALANLSTNDNLPKATDPLASIDPLNKEGQFSGPRRFYDGSQLVASASMPQLPVDDRAPVEMLRKTENGMVHEVMKEMLPAAIKVNVKAKKAAKTAAATAAEMKEAGGVKKVRGRPPGSTNKKPSSADEAKRRSNARAIETDKLRAILKSADSGAAFSPGTLNKLNKILSTPEAKAMIGGSKNVAKKKHDFEIAEAMTNNADEDETSSSSEDEEEESNEAKDCEKSKSSKSL